MKRAVCFAVSDFGAARGLPASENLTAVVSVGVDDDYLEHGSTVKFATEHHGFPDYYDDLERYGMKAMTMIREYAIFGE